MLSPIYVDCVEFYSEKLISTYASIFLDNIIQKLFREAAAGGDKHTITEVKKVQKRLQVKTCKNFPMLLDVLQGLNEAIAELHATGELHKLGLGNLNFFFYFVLDNASIVLQHERQKKTVTKLCVAQSLSTPQCFSVILIDTKLYGGSLDGCEIFKDTMPQLYEEYMFAPFILSPMGDSQLKKIIYLKLEQRLLIVGRDNNKEQHETQLLILNKVFESMYTLLIKEVQNYTTNVNEYVYFFTFLYDHYIQPLKGLYGFELEERLKRPLVGREFKTIITMLQSAGLYMHVTSLEEIKQQLKEEEEENFVDRVRFLQKKPGQRQDEVIFDHRKINYLETSKRNLNYSYMQSLCLIGAYLAGAVKDKLDVKIFCKAQHKMRRITAKPKEGQP